MNTEESERVAAEKTLLECTLEDPIVHCCFKMRAGSELVEAYAKAWAELFRGMRQCTLKVARDMGIPEDVLKKALEEAEKSQVAVNDLTAYCDGLLSACDSLRAENAKLTKQLMEQSKAREERDKLREALSGLLQVWRSGRPFVREVDTADKLLEEIGDD